MKNVFIILLIIVIFTLFYFILIGRFCHCTTIQCPNHNILKEYIA